VTAASDIEIRVEPGSFRDRQGRVYLQHDRVIRALSSAAQSDWEALQATRFFARFVDKGHIVSTRQVGLADTGLADESSAWVAALEHERIPFISYPYEWSFSMLRDGARLHLDLLLAALDEGMILKDSSAYNIQWVGTRPVHIDIPSFQKLQQGEAWVGYLQFCQLFLYPLMLNAYRNVAFHAWLRGAIDGLTPAQCNSLMSLRDRFRKGVLTHVYLQSKLQASTADSKSSLRSQLQSAGFDVSLIRRNATKLRRLVDGLNWREASSEWVQYADEHSYTDADDQQKQAFVAETAARRTCRMVWDLGCNTGTYSRIVAPHTETVVAMDGDHLAVERLYQDLRSQGPQNVLPLVVNLADPSPDLGWRGRERRSLEQRGRPDLVLCLALVHHMVITANIPLSEFVEWLAGLGAAVVIEFVTKEDPMVHKLLLNKDDIYDDYTLDNFESCAVRHFRIFRRQVIHDGTRVLFELEQAKE